MGRIQARFVSVELDFENLAKAKKFYVSRLVPERPAISQSECVPFWSFWDHPISRQP